MRAGRTVGRRGDSSMAEGPSTLLTGLVLAHMRLRQSQPSWSTWCSTAILHRPGDRLGMRAARTTRPLDAGDAVAF
jgi:hypothetical protein